MNHVSRFNMVRQRFRPRRPWRDRVEDHAAIFADFTAKSRPSISWHVNATRRQISRISTGRNTSEVRIRDAYDSNYALSVTWTPGTLTLAGDIGSLVLTHYHAMPTIEATLNWLRSADHDYLMGKSSAKKVFDADATAEHLIHAANEAAFDAAWETVEELRTWRHELREALGEWEEMAGGIFGPPDPDFGLPDRPPAASITHRTALSRRSRGTSDFDVPEGWHLWHSLQQELNPFADPNDIFTVGGRQDVKDRLRGSLEDGQHAAAELCSKIEYDDYYGSECWPGHTYTQIAAIKHWVKLADAEVFPEEKADA